MNKNKFNWIAYFYSHFLSRDLTYVFAGGLFIYIVYYSFKDCGYLPKDFSFETIAYLLLSYFIGFAISEFGDRIHLVNKSLRKREKNRSKNKKSKKDKNRIPKLLLIKQNIKDNYTESLLIELERINFHMHIGASIGSAILFGSLTMIYKLIFIKKSININIILITLGLLILAAFMVYYSRKKSKQMIDCIEYLYENKDKKDKIQITDIF